ncbi:MAG: peptidyl-tRNA hydrolase Pth2 [Candidatus Micrarchaeota archaeon]
MASTSEADEIKQVMVVRNDLQIGKGKMAVQVAHASIDAYLKCEKKEKEIAKEWLGNGMGKSVVKVEGEKELIEIFQKAKERGLPASLITDAGKTQILPGTKTCVGIGPGRAGEIDKITGELKLL